MNDFFQAFLPNVGATFVGVVVGIPVAFFIERARDEQRRRKTEGALLQTYVEAINMNREFLTGVQDFSEGQAEPRRLDTILLEALTSKAVDVLHDVDLLRHLERFRYELSQLNRDFDFHLHMAAGPLRAAYATKGRPLSESYPEFKPILEGYRNRIIEFAGDLDKEAEKLLSEIAATPSYQEAERERVKEKRQ